MKINVKHLLKLVCVIVTMSIFAGLMAGSLSQVYALDSNPQVIPPGAKAYGMTYGEWSARWYQWVYSLPVDRHPLFDTADCSEGQTGKVWFLGGTYTFVEEDGVVKGEADRDCSMPFGTALFLPIMNAECNQIVDGYPDEESLRECANYLADHIQDLKATIDGKELKHLGLYRAESPLFTIGPLPADNILGADPGATAPSVADGFYIMLAPLSRGEHYIHFEGAAVFTLAEDGFDFLFELDIDYRITVEPRSGYYGSLRTVDLER